ncbi:fibronectin type III domain-containing protein [Pseudomonas fluorescens]|uniref:fibronectin type III domain-containing protein n=1 Tax=Pseudomonas fluorescens TaxID=294 RepID=UPI0012424CAE|nr:fibronectin type III domain-containing protein [Pseudomonas fluorescens]VVM57596.1 hypothetical protein PS639_01106 [Pseudomonas fluorescens]
MSRSDSSSPDSPTGTDFNTESGSAIQICAPGNVRGWRNSPTSALLNWDEPYSTCQLCPDAIGYDVFGEGIATHSVGRPPCELTGLKPDVEYLFYVMAKAAANNVSTPSPVRVFKRRPPGKPGTPELMELSHAAATLSWAPSSQGDGNTRYRVYLNGFLVKRVAQPQVSLTHLQSLTDYRVEVQAVNESGVSERSFMTFQTRLRPPSNLRFSHRNGKCRLAWDPIFKKKPTHELSINGQQFTVAPGRWGYNFKLADVSPGPVPHHLKFAVHAQLDGINSEVALLEQTLIDDVPPGRPGTPVVRDVTDTSATLSWEPSSDNVGVTEYRVLLNGVIPYTSADTLCTFTNLSSGTYHWAFVRARDKDGNLSTPSRIAVFNTTGQAPSPQPAPPPVEITALTSTSANLGWTLESRVSGVRISINDEHFRDVLFLDRLPLKDLTPDVEYSISVSAFDIFGQLSEPTVVAYMPRDVTPPGTPGNLRKGDVTADSVMLAWEESTDDVGLHEYVIYNNCEYFDRTPLTHYTAVDLLPGTYSFEVCAMDLSGNASEPAALTVSIEGEL